MVKNYRLLVLILPLFVFIAFFAFLRLPSVFAADAGNSNGQTPIRLFPRSVPSSPLGDFVLDNVIPYRSTHWKPQNERWWPNTQRGGRLSGVKVLEVATGKYWIRAKATRIRWTQASLDWIQARAGKFVSIRITVMVPLKKS